MTPRPDLRGAALALLCAAAPAGAAQRWGWLDQDGSRALLRAAVRDLASAPRPSEGTWAQSFAEIAAEQFLNGDAEGGTASVALATASLAGQTGCAAVSVLIGVGKAQHQAGLAEASSETFRTVFEGGMTEPRTKRSDCLEPLAIAVAEAGDVPWALAIAASAPGIRKSDAYPAIASVLSRRGLFEEAIAVADKAAPTWADKGISEAIDLQAEGPRWREAAARFSAIMEREADWVYAAAAGHAAESGDFEKAYAAARMLEGSDAASGEWQRIALAHARLGQRDAAVAVATRTLSNPDARAALLFDIADIEEGAGDSAGALKVRGLAEASSAEGDREADRARRFADLVRRGLLDRALPLLESEDHVWKALIVKSSVLELAERGRFQEACRLIDQVDVKFSQGQDRDEKQAAMAALAKAMARRGDIAGAVALVAEGERQYLNVRMDVAQEIAAAQARNGDIRAAVDTLRRRYGGDRDIYAADYAWLAAAEVETQDFPRVPVWAAKLERPEQRVAARLGAVRGLRRRK